jgi:hypothetical protein
LSETENPNDLRKFNEFINDDNSWFLGITAVAGVIYGTWEGLQDVVKILMDVYLRIKEGITISLSKRWQLNASPNFEKKGIDFKIQTGPNPLPKEPNSDDLDLPKIPPENSVPKNDMPNGQPPQNETDVKYSKRKERHEM